ncbi:hypothetical protein B0J17DRAFT_217152 [Rhizoctonia solani]|nr:hypothetical protein B0J17DRAFT_217152 [Rhizoctonia solani]
MPRQLTELTLPISQALNKSAPSLSELPEDVLSVIFMDIVFERTNTEAPWFLPGPVMEKDVLVIYRRIYNLLHVCRAWREVVLPRGALWSVIPMVMDPKEPPNKSQPYQLCLQRAGGSNLHLVATVTFSISSVFFRSPSGARTSL